MKTVESFLKEEYKKSVKKSLDVDNDVLRQMEKSSDISRQIRLHQWLWSEEEFVMIDDVYQVAYYLKEILWGVSVMADKIMKEGDNYNPKDLEMLKWLVAKKIEEEKQDKISNYKGI